MSFTRAPIVPNPSVMRLWMEQLTRGCYDLHDRCFQSTEPRSTPDRIGSILQPNNVVQRGRVTSQHSKPHGALSAVPMTMQTDLH